MRTTSQSRSAGLSRAVVGVLLLGVVLVGTVTALPITGNEDHALSHLALAVPVLMLAALIIRAARADHPVRAVRVARDLLLTGLLLLGGGTLVEAVGAAGYTDGGTRTSRVAVLHDLGVLITPLGIFLTIAGTVCSCGVAFAERRGAAPSRYVTAAVVVAAVAALAFLGGALVFGY